MSVEWIIVSSLFLYGSVVTYYAVRFGMLLLRLEDDIEDSLDELDVSFKNLTDILQKPIFFDSIEVRQCIDEIRNTRRVVVRVADRLTSFGYSNEQNNNIGDRASNDSQREEENSIIKK